ncbi:uncharacterized protein [Linepithema humile]|uniref:uncharacterized protein n=1 Tax=Linepithema humile TaxID=83485 RepID=UPI00062327D2|nr:PREDICTED: uncharacterized protein LOC105679289 [Linepithema humile]
MKKRKISVEKNSEYRETSAHSSVANLKATNHLRRSRSAKSPFVQNLHNLDLSEKIAKPENNRTMLPDEMQPPKTRFTSRDRSKETRSISSPRLKSFPAEKIKKLNNSPMFTPEPINALIMQQDPRETRTFFASSSVRSNNGHGDVMFAQLSPVHQQTKSQNTSSTSQQQIVANHQQPRQTNPHSENLLTRQIASSERQVHHPFVPNVFQGAVNPSTIINQPVIIQPSSTQMPQQTSSNSHAVIDQNHNETTALDSKCEKQPISGRNAINHRQMFVQMQQQKQEEILRNAKALLNNRSANDCQNVYHPQLYYQFHQNPQRIYQQSPRDAYHQQMPPHMTQQIYNNLGTCCNYYNRQLSTAQALGQGMTSPQDVTVNQMRLMQHNLPIHQRNHGYPVNSSSVWPQNNGWMQATSRNQQHLHQQPQWQYYYYQTPTAKNMNFNQQNSRNQSQPNPSQNQTNYKSTNQQPAMAAYNRQDGGNKTLQFTPEMIRDQELLVSSMRQQGTPDQVMQRQFDALLNEQRRHLAYVAQFQQQKDTVEVKETQLARRRTEKNEKPEWMVHITPPRISYNEIGRIETQVGAKEQCLTDGQSPEEMNRIIAAQEENYNQQKKAEISNQIVSPQQMYLRMNPHQQMVSWMYRNDQVPYGYAGRYLYGHQQNAPINAYYRPNPSFNDYIQYSYNMPYNHQCHSRAEQEIRTKKHNLNSSNSIDTAHFYQQNKRLTEPSSLLKMRVYKEVICPQKRNNGLQDPHTIQKTLEALKDPANRRSLQYLANLTKKKPVIKLNGTQDPDEIPEDMQPRSSIEITSQFRKGVSANGLENTRNSDNPSPRILRPKRADEPMMMEYPRQGQNTRTCYSMQAEKENDNQQQTSHAVAHAQDAGSIPYDPQSASTAHRCGNGNGNNAMIFQYASAPSQDYHQMQQYYLNRQNLTGHNGGQGDVASMRRPDISNANRINRAGGDTGEKSGAKETTKHTNDVQAMQGTNASIGQSEIREARTIGGITYLASKSEYGINNFVVSPNKLIANRHLQPPRIF